MNSRVALITFLDGLPGLTPGYPLPQPPVYPGHGLPTPTPPGGPVDPGYGQGQVPVDPGYGHGGGGPYPTPGPVPTPNPPTGGNLPAMPPIGPDNTLPDSEGPPTISLPIYLPEPPARDRKFELKYSYRYGWVLVPVGGPPTPEPK